MGVACHAVEVPLVAGGAAPGRLHLRVQVIGSGTGVAPLFAIAGGPGQSATALEESFEAMLSPLRGRRPLVLFDQRGTGLSGVLRCPALERAGSGNAAAAARCAHRLGPRREHYLTADSVRDLEAVRKALGIQRIALYAVSYGSRLALAYARAHPGRVERIVLDSPVPLGGPDPLMRSTLAAIPRVLRAECTSGCPGGGRAPARDLKRLVARLRAGGDPGARRRLALLGILQAGEWTPGLRSALPGAVRAALAGNQAPLSGLARRSRALSPESAPPRQFSAATNAAVACRELDLPWPRETHPRDRPAFVRRAVAALPVRALGPFDRATAAHSEVIELCARWPGAGSRNRPASPLLAGTPKKGPAGGWPPAAPTLVLAGGLDLLTPLSDSRRLVRLLPRGRLVSVPDAGHTVLARLSPRGRAARVVRRFLAVAP